MMIRSPNTAHGRGQPIPPPAWRRGLTALEWVQIGSNTLSDVDPTADPAINPNHPSTAPWASAGQQQDITIAWSGGAWDETNKRLWIMGGGHSGYNGNEPYSINLGLKTPIWTRHGYPTGSIQRPVASCTTRKVGDTEMMQDGRPFTTHTYNLLTVLGNGILLQAKGGFALDGSGTAAVEYDPTVSDWDVSTGRYTVSGPSVGVRGGVDFDPARNVCWAVAAQSISKYDVATKVISLAYQDYTGKATYGPIKRMPDSDLFVFFGDHADGMGTGKHVFLFDPAAPSTTPVGINATTSSWYTRGVTYDTLRKRFLAWSGGGSVDTLTPPASSPKSNAWTYGSLTTSTDVVTPSAGNTNGTYGRFQYCAAYDCCFALNVVTERLYVLPLS